MKHIAIIGTAGRDPTKPMTKKLWEKMTTHASGRFRPDGEYHLYSGGAAWADHLAVHLFLAGEVGKLTLHLPAPFDFDKLVFEGGKGSAGSAANFYHEKFSTTLKKPSRQQLLLARDMGATITTQPISGHGYGPMFARNALIAKDAVDGVLAYTWGDNEPTDGGTAHCWSKCQGRKIHIPLQTL